MSRPFFTRVTSQCVSFAIIQCTCIRVACAGSRAHVARDKFCAIGSQVRLSWLLTALSLVHTGACGKAACDAVHTGACGKAVAKPHAACNAAHTGACYRVAPCGFVACGFRESRMRLAVPPVRLYFEPTDRDLIFCM